MYLKIKEVKSFEKHPANVASVLVIMSQTINTGTLDRKMPVTKVLCICLALVHVMLHLTLIITPVEVLVGPTVQKGN